MTNSQSIDGYKCSCGFITEDKKKFFGHFRLNRQAKREGTERHESQGRVNMLTGEITMPSYNERTPDQKAESNFGRKETQLRADGKARTLRTTEMLAQASEIRFVPRIYTTTYTPIMMQAQDASVKVWGWRSNMPLENFLDTVLFMFFKEHGVELGQYTVDPTVYSGAPDDNHDNHDRPDNYDEIEDGPPER